MSDTQYDKMKKFDGLERHDWPEFEKKMLAYGGIKGGWDEALENVLDMTDPDNVKSNKLGWSYLTIMLEGEALCELDGIAGKNAHDAWQHLKAKYEPTDDRAYADLEMKFVQCEMKTPDENPEVWINQLIQINKRIENCHATQKKSDVMMIAHVLSKLPKEEKYYKNFIAMTRRLGYNKQTIVEFKKEVYDYWITDIKKSEEAEEKDYDEEAYATYGSKEGYKRGNPKKPQEVEKPKQHMQNTGASEQKGSQMVWTNAGPMVVPMGMMSPGQDSTIIKDHMQELVIMQTRPGEQGSTPGGNTQSQFVYVPMEMLQKMMSNNQVNNVQVQSNMIPGQHGKPKCTNCGRDGHLKQNCFAAGGGKEGQWPARNNSHIKCFKCQKMGHYARECKQPEKEPEPMQSVNSTEEETEEENFFAGVMEDKESIEDVCVHEEEKELVEEFLIDSGATCHVTYNDAGMKNKVPSKSIIYMGDESKAEVAASGNLNVRVCNTSIAMTLKPINYVPSFKKHIMSVSRLCKEGYEVTITDQECRIKTIEGGYIIVKKSKDGMFYLDVTRKDNGFVMSSVEKETIIEELVEKEKEIKQEEKEIKKGSEEIQVKESKKVRFQETRDINELHDQLGHVSEGII